MGILKRIFRQRRNIFKRSNARSAEPKTIKTKKERVPFVPLPPPEPVKSKPAGDDNVAEFSSYSFN